MIRLPSSSMSFFLIIFCFNFLQKGLCVSNKIYIVKTKGNSLLREKRVNPSSSVEAYTVNLVKQHDAILSSLSRRQPSVSKIYSYVHVLNGFAASLNENQVQELREHDEVEWVMESRDVKASTTHTPTFLGLNGGNNPVWKKYTGRDIIIGVIDTGIFPGNPSFRGSGLSKPPSKFKGICQKSTTGPEFRCNNKVIGARYFYKAYLEKEKDITKLGKYISAFDGTGHGTHAASTAAGSKVSRIQFSSVEYGTASGMAFNARIVAYKVLWGSNGSGSTADVVAALEAGVEDGVDMFSLSLGGEPIPLYLDQEGPITRSVVSAGIPVVYAAGNEGWGTASNTFPWVLTVAASSFGRTIRNKVVLENEVEFEGVGSLIGSSLDDEYYPLVDAASAAAPGFTSDRAELCDEGSLDPSIVAGSIVLCKNGEISGENKSTNVFEAGGAGMILYNQPGNTALISNIYEVPYSHVSESDGLAIADYIANSDSPAAIIQTGSVALNVSSAPQIADFSSTGPPKYLPHLIKPDITAPGVNIIAAYSEASFSFSSGTSMATPHVAGVVALIKSAHPTWKPSWIYSAIITTGNTFSRSGGIKDAEGYLASPFHMGGGHIDVQAALDPGLVYNMDAADYENFDCTEFGGYYETENDCAELMREIDFNLPYLSLPKYSASVTVTRKLTLVGTPAAYSVSVEQPACARVIVRPSRLSFVRVGQTLSYSISVRASASSCKSKVPYDPRLPYTFGAIKWSSGKRVVKMNVAVNTI